MKNSNFINYILLLCIALAHIGPMFVAACRGFTGVITLSTIVIFLK